MGLKQPDNSIFCTFSVVVCDCFYWLLRASGEDASLFGCFLPYFSVYCLWGLFFLYDLAPFCCYYSERLGNVYDTHAYLHSNGGRGLGKFLHLENFNSPGNVRDTAFLQLYINVICIYTLVLKPGVPGNGPFPGLLVLLPGPGTGSLIPQDREWEAKTGNSKFNGTGSRQDRERAQGPGAHQNSQKPENILKYTEHTIQH